MITLSTNPLVSDKWTFRSICVTLFLTALLKSSLITTVFKCCAISLEYRSPLSWTIIPSSFLIHKSYISTRILNVGC